jgi:hypothetical protein
MNVLDYATLAVSTSAVSLTADASPNLPSTCNRVFITCETQPVRWRADGTDPTASTGHLLAKDDSISFTGVKYRQLLEKIRFIATVAGDGALKITYFD